MMERNGDSLTGGKKVVLFTRTTLAKRINPLIVPIDTVILKKIRNAISKIPAIMNTAKRLIHRLLHVLHFELPNMAL